MRLTNAVEVLSDEVLEQLCVCLPGRELLALAGASTALQHLAADSAVIWSHLSRALLGEALCHLHLTLNSRRGHAADANFWRALFRRGHEFKLARWSLDLRAAFLRSVVASGGRSANDEIRQMTCGSGHSSVGIGGLVFKCGGLRPECKRDAIHTSVFNLETLRMYEVELAADSAKVGRRLRHAACEARPAFLSGRPALLVLGGCHDRTKAACPGGLRVLNFLELLSDDGSSGRWHSLEAGGDAPAAIWHHICGSFSKGKRVVVFGGDFPRGDPEFMRIADRAAPASGVYVLDVDVRTWAHVATSGPAPTWRSLHAGLTHRDPLSHSERLVVLGGCAEHVPIFSSSDELAEMRGHALDLRSFEWLPQPESRGGWSPPPARLRFATEKVGEWLLLYGGHGDSEEIGERATLHKLNLRTLRWGALSVLGREGRFPAAPAASMTAGLVLGGVTFGAFGISPVPKLDVLTLCDEGAGLAAEEVADAEATAGEAQAAGDAEEEDEEEVLVRIGVRDQSGNTREVVVPRFLLRQLLARAGGGREGDDEEAAPQTTSSSSSDAPAGDEERGGGDE